MTGPEKLLEVWFAESARALPPRATSRGLKEVAVDTWKEMLDLVNCQVLSIIESEHVDAYLLSESSMFVFPHKLILKTCGTTTLLCGLPRILEIAAKIAYFPSSRCELPGGALTAATPYRVFYSRKNFLFPDRQKGPHRSWRDEVRSLDKLFLRGSAYMIGKMNGDHWYLYLTEPNTMLTPPATPPHAGTGTDSVNSSEVKHLDVPDSAAAALVNRMSNQPDEVDETLEILMTDLKPETSKQFFLDHASTVAEGRYFHEARRARRQAAKHLGTIEESNGFDVFGQTSTENASFSSSDDELEPYPVDLTTEGHALGTVISDSTGLARLYPKEAYPGAQLDAYLFTPCGFSANGVIPSARSSSGDVVGESHYFTVHVTPETAYSYASFETNVPCGAGTGAGTGVGDAKKQAGRTSAQLVEQVVDIFKPGRFSVTLFEAKTGAMFEVDGKAGAWGGGNVDRNRDRDYGIGAGAGAKTRSKAVGGLDAIRGYRRMDRIVHDLEGYELVFRYYERFDWEGGEPRFGEL